VSRLEPAADASTQRRSATRSRGILLVAAAALCWSSGGLLARIVDTDTWTTVLWRGMFSAVFLLGVGAVQARRSGAGLGFRLGWPGLVIAVGFATASTCFINALARTSVANALVLQCTSPFIAALLGWATMGERVRTRTWLAMAAALCGTAVMASRSWGAGSIAGDVLAVITAASFAAAAVTVRGHAEVNLPAAAGLAGLLGAAVAWWPAQPLSASAGDLALLAAFGAGQLGLGLMLFTAGARLIPVAEASLIAVLESVLGPLWVWLAVGEAPSPASLAGGGIILGALVAHTAVDLRRAPPSRVR
jgi:drug/metabolite transporter (DMT)-like permease